MSVYTSRRKESTAKFIQEARNLRIFTIQILKRFPKSYRYIFVNNLLDLAASIYTDCIKANTVYVCSTMPQVDIDLRRQHLTQAYTACGAIIGEISFCYEYVNQGNNFFPDKIDYNKKFEQWITLASSTKKLIKGVMDSDKKRIG